MPTEKALYSPESRAVKIAARDIRAVMQKFKDGGKIPFLEPKRSGTTQKKYDEITGSALASQLLSEGYPADFCYRVAKLERDQMAAGIDPTALAANPPGGGP
jgi:hypothetical protein